MYVLPAFTAKMRGVAPLLSCSLTLAPSFMSFWTDNESPFEEALISGVEEQAEIINNTAMRESKNTLMMPHCHTPTRKANIIVLN